MRTYAYRGFDPQGRSRRGLVEALSVKHARKKLADGGVLVERVAPTERRVRVRGDARAMIYRELSALLGAGVPLLRALAILIESPELRGTHIPLAGVRDRVREGASLADALAEASPSITDFERSLVEAAERSATVEIILERLATFLEEQETFRQRLQGALIYPSIVVGVGICVGVLMLGVLLPQSRRFLLSDQASLPGLTRFMLGFGAFVARWIWLLLVLLLVGGSWLRARLKRDEEWRRRWDQSLFSVPLVGRGYTLLVNLRFCRTLSILLRGGVALLDGFVLAGRATGSAWVAGLVEGEAESVRHGGTLAQSLRRIPPLSAALPGWVDVGEASGKVAELLERAGQRLQGRWERFLDGCLKWLEPVLILIVGVFVLLVTLSVLLPILALSEGLS